MATQRADKTDAFDFDPEAINQELQAKLHEKQAPSRERAIEKLGTVLDGSLSFHQIVSYLKVMAEKYPYVKENVKELTWDDVVNQGYSAAPRARRAPRPKASGGTGGRSRSEATEQAIQAMMDFVAASNGAKLTKRQIIEGSIEGSPDIPESACNTAWPTVRQGLGTTGDGPATKYFSKK